MKRNALLRIYSSRKHLAATFGIIILPFLFFIFFARLTEIRTEDLFLDIGISFIRLIAAYCISVVLAWILAVLFYKGGRGAVALPIFDVLQSFPTFAALPIGVYFFGSSNAVIIFFLVLTIVWPILFSIISSLKLIKRDWEEAVEIFGLSGFQYMTKFLLPVSIPGLVTGTIIGLGEGWEALIATEIIVRAPVGLGSFFGAFSHDPAITAFGILGFLLLVFSINKLIWLPLLEWSHERMEE